MGHAVVHLPGNTSALLRRGQRAARVAFAFEPPRPVSQLDQVSAAGAHVEAHQQDSACEAGRVGNRHRPVPRAILRHDEEHDTGYQRRRGQRLGPRPGDGDAVEADGQRDREQCPVSRPLGQGGRGQQSPQEHWGGARRR
jgi:hypothetical protein